MSKKILAICHGFFKSTIIRGILPWEELGYHLIIGLNDYYSIDAIRKINPDVLIVVDYVPGQTIGTILETYRKETFPVKIILIPYELDVVSKEDKQRYQVIEWNHLDSGTLADALSNIFDHPSLYESDILPRNPYSNVFRASLEAFAEHEPVRPLILVRFLFRNAPVDSVRENAVRLIQRLANEIGLALLLEESEAAFCTAIKIASVILGDSFRRMTDALYELQESLCRSCDTQVVLFLSEFVSSRSVWDEYENLKALQPYAFFHSHHGVLSATFIQRHMAQNDIPIGEVNSLYMPLLGALLHRDEAQVYSILERIYLKYIKSNRNMAFYRLVHSELQAIYICACSINGEKDPQILPMESRWSVEEALEAEYTMFRSHMDLAQNLQHKPGRLTLRALEIILQQHTRPIYAADIAEKLHVSEAHLSRTFKADLQIGITECITYVRIYSAAITLLEGDTHIKDAAARHGFADAKYFNKVFKKVTGKTPTQWLAEKSK